MFNNVLILIMIIFDYDYEHYAECNNKDKFNNSAVFFYGVPILPRIMNNRISIHIYTLHVAAKPALLLMHNIVKKSRKLFYIVNHCMSRKSADTSMPEIFLKQRSTALKVCRLLWPTKLEV